MALLESPSTDDMVLYCFALTVKDIDSIRENVSARSPDMVNCFIVLWHEKIQIWRKIMQKIDMSLDFLTIFARHV